VAFAFRLMHLLAKYPSIQALELPMPANRGCIVCLACMPGLRRLTLDLFHPQLPPGGVADPAMDLAAGEGQLVLGAVLAATRQVTHLTLKGSGYSKEGVPIPPQLRHSTNLQAYNSNALHLLIGEEQHWEAMAGAVSLVEVAPAVTLKQPPSAAACLPAVRTAWLLPRRLADLGPMLAALPALDKAVVVLEQGIDTAVDPDQVSDVGGVGCRAWVGWYRAG
jgi:hypothetical protein